MLLCLKNYLGWAYTSKILKCLPDMHKAQGSFLTITDKNNAQSAPFLAKII